MVIRMNASARCGCFVVILLSVKHQHKLELLEKPGYIILISRVMENGIWEEKQGILQIKKSLKYWLNAIQKASLLFHTKWFRLFTISFMSSLPISDIYLRNTKTAFEEPSISTKAQIHTFSQSRLENIAAIWREIVLSEHPYLNAKKPEHNSKNVVSGLVVWSSCSKLIWVEKKRLIAEFYQNIDSLISERYTVQAPYKTGAGIGVLKLITEHNRAHAVFSCHEHCYAQIMVGRTGPTSVGPGSVVSGNANPVRLTTSVIGVPCGEFSNKLTTGAVTMTTLPTQSHPEITIINGRVVTTSLAVSNYFTKRHERVLDRIRNLECSAEFTEHNFVLSEYTDASGRKLPCYQITRDGFAFLAMGFTGKRAARFKEAYINAFNQMEKNLSGADAVDMSAVARNARGVYLHLREIHQIWKSQLYPMLKAVESPLASKLYDRVGDAVFGAALVDSRLNGSDKEAHP
nr:Rha family phage regulatory protein [Escherichia coli]